MYVVVMLFWPSPAGLECHLGWNLARRVDLAANTSVYHNKGHAAFFRVKSRMSLLREMTTAPIARVRGETARAGLVGAIAEIL
jgi:hypothetical protein